MSMARAMARKMGMAWKMGMVRGLREEFAAKNWKLSSMVMDRGKLASVQHHSNMQRLREEIWDEVDIACSIDKECPYLSQYEHHCFWNNDYKSLKEYLQHLRTFNLDNKDMNPHFNPAEIQPYENELAEKTQKTSSPNRSQDHQPIQQGSEYKKWAEGEAGICEGGESS
ncbi:uncharacterized protein LOC110700510 [Chenopodium quinoa]|uniref:uncharacterized protein LOC110700510 n=1 Tax=Chenopodium quinoa TaxID=63459 RepID=UPI000B777164|nr:uncharacterized protein LOC110700510 [Chenopodium quinoa]